MEEQVRYSMIIDLKQHAADESKNLEDIYKVLATDVKNEEEVNVAPAIDTSDRNIVNLGDVRRNIPDGRHTYKNLLHGNNEDILKLLEHRMQYPDTAVVLKDELCLDDGYLPQGSFTPGGFATSVDLCLDIRSARNFVRKEIKVSKFRAREVEHLCRLNCHNISKILGFCVKSDRYEILLEYCGLDLHSAMQMEWNLIIDEQLDSFITQIAEAIYHCNHQNIFHLDIKPQNVCVYAFQNCIKLKLTDFGASKDANSEFFSEGVTLMYAAPEIHYDCCKKFLLHCDRNSGKYQEVLDMTQDFCKNYHTCSVTEKCDLFSVGLVCLFIKWHNDPWKLLLKQVKYGIPKMYSRYPDIMKSLVDAWGSLASLISSLLTGDPSERCSVNDIFVFMKKLSDKKHEMDVANCRQVINEVNAVQPTEEEMQISPNIPNMDLLF
ncbi:serine/threonine-protein kinase SBK1 [Octopus bimaculoides]|uniref:Protein kinase domain-containing protein n=1 Tax=Octopus bimaculoides TaxID=37653 RepID=A0A0L8HJJ5_OCTBM|nr:serine/threonine-protein kinase SBK1 [Octopus bimaculoides]XP_014772132.1 serine/threonine-protein kinase SBK1 [Octopus bimaculoides]|eukprot:XP_014772131.1 PREDICTED: putative mitogen-activated protein kinase kinase kinase 7-like [Octopus bimaculoides]